MSGRSTWVRRRSWLNEHPGSTLGASHGAPVTRRVYGPRPDQIRQAMERGIAREQAAAEGKRKSAA